MEVIIFANLVDNVVRGGGGGGSAITQLKKLLKWSLNLIESRFILIYKVIFHSQ